ncbi:Predicted metalloprotease, contains C-terminal PDZ domain [Salinimicrobium catena]|uniref:Predicted metalloprotease, contains C-terminal PDZ domain n=1 Tax=Salinimicrobium catena TaxID=390640 RepID=A0A1H5JBZ8_9FLAO|nr:PDZ domain-containing protein [Salinimicrobium catena]SDK86432.1 Predicted metalloprotease, contains C-terminal PDZ domain [Salinimicrobium catena]SEE50056.1 Predicted metalloprotease, contains C-terminal PDZ domain [Salinimicrobium catena]
MRIFLLLLFFTTAGFSQTVEYQISFKNAVHHEAKITATFPKVETDTLTLRMSRTSPGRYALHEFAKNVYGVKAKDSKGQPVQISRPDPYSWQITGHDGTVKLEYTLFGNRADGTYTQIDETHAHLNIPATFMYSEDLKERPVEVNFDLESQPDWKVATQLKQLEGNKYYAPDLYYFMDSPTEISDYDMRQFQMDGQNIRFVLHHQGTEAELDEYFEKVKKIVAEQKAIFGELPEFDFGEYTFLACYMPNVSGDGMEHRNSTILTSTRSLAESGMDRNIGTVAHEFFHAWNVERLRPLSLEPFDFTEANMSGALWFAEGFTSYYTPLTLVRGDIISPEEYAKGLNGTFNYVWNSPGTRYFNPVEMSYQAPFVDAATSVDPVNRENTFISYYSYGSMLGLALDLKLRMEGLNLDDYMKLLWETYGEPEKPYTLEDLESSLAQYAGKDLARIFFENYIYDSKMPNYEELFRSVGLKLERGSEKAFFGPSVLEDTEGIYISGNPAQNSPAYKAGLDKGDRILKVNGKELKTEKEWNEILNNSKVGDTLKLEILRFGTTKKIDVELEKDPTYTISLDEQASKAAKKARNKWLGNNLPR